MNEKEIIKYFKEVISWYRKNTPDRVYALNNKDIEMLQGLLDLYQKEKEKNESLEQENNFLKQVYRGTDEFKAIEKLANKNY